MQKNLFGLKQKLLLRKIFLLYHADFPVDIFEESFLLLTLYVRVKILKTFFSLVKAPN